MTTVIENRSVFFSAVRTAFVRYCMVCGIPIALLLVARKAAFTTTGYLIVGPPTLVVTFAIYFWFCVSGTKAAVKKNEVFRQSFLAADDERKGWLIGRRVF